MGICRIGRWPALLAVLTVLPLWAQAGTAPATAAPGGKPTGAGPGGLGTPPLEQIKLSFDNTPIVDAAKILGEQIDALILVDPKLGGTVTLKREVPKAFAPVALAALVEGTASRAVIFCTEEQARGKAELKTEKKVKLSLTQEAKISKIAALLAATTERKVLCTPEVAEKLALVQLDTEQDLAKVLDTVAEKAKIKWVSGWLIGPEDKVEQQRQMLQGLQMWNALPADQREKMMSDGIDRAIAEFRNMPASDRKEALSMFSAGLDRFTKVMAGAGPEMQTKLKEALKPMVEMGMRKYMGLDTGMQAELRPVLEKLQSLR